MFTSNKSDTVAFQSAHGKYLGCLRDGTAVATDKIHYSDRRSFFYVYKSKNCHFGQKTCIAIRNARDNRWVRAKEDGTLLCERSTDEIGTENVFYGIHGEELQWKYSNISFMSRGYKFSGFEVISTKNFTVDNSEGNATKTLALEADDMIYTQEFKNYVNLTDEFTDLKFQSRSPYVKQTGELWLLWDPKRSHQLNVKDYDPLRVTYTTQNCTAEATKKVICTSHKALFNMHVIFQMKIHYTELDLYADIYGHWEGKIMHSMALVILSLIHI